jgi:DNA-binding MarR family transcriptional regulator
MAPQMAPRNETLVAGGDEKVVAADELLAAGESLAADESFAADESRVVTADDPVLVAAWRELADRHARTTWALERSLNEQHGLGVSEFEVLERLAEPDKDQRRMQELAKAVHLSQSALSRVVGRLEDEGLVVRGICHDDRRGIYACLTDAGRARYEAARPTHRGVLAEMLDVG